jgi:hypothetical protein
MSRNIVFVLVYHHHKLLEFLSFVCHDQSYSSMQEDVEDQQPWLHRVGIDAQRGSER